MYLLSPNHGSKLYQISEKLKIRSPITLQRNKIYLLIYSKTVSLRSYAVIYPSVQLSYHQIQTQFKKNN